MAAFEVIALDTATPQLRAPGASDTYTFPRAVEMPLGTANGVLFLNASKVVTSGSTMQFDGTTLGIYNGTADAQRLNLGTSGTNALINATRASGTVPQMLFSIDGSEQMRLTSTGLGIGASSPASRLNVVGDQLIVSGGAGTSQLGIQIKGGAITSLPSAQVHGYIAIGDSAIGLAGDLLISPRTDVGCSIRFITGTTPTERMRLDASGNLGLGVTPSAWITLRALDIASTGGFFATTAQAGIANNAFFNGTNWIYKTSTNATFFRATGSVFEWHTAPSGTAGNAISFTQAMTLDAGSRLGVGTTDTANTTVHFANSDPFNRPFRITNTGGANAFSVRVGTGATLVTTDGSQDLLFGTNATERARITSGGSLVVGTAALATSATDGFLYVPTCAGTPTGTPTTQTGTAPIVVDSTNNKLYFYSGGQWRDAGP